MRNVIVYSDENPRTEVAREIADSYGLHSKINDAIKSLCKYSYGINRVEVSLLQKCVEEHYKICGFEFGKDVKHAHGIGNNNELFIKDVQSGEFVATVYFNSDMYGGVYFGVGDINGKRISDRYKVSEHGIRSIEQIEKSRVPYDWNAHYKDDVKPELNDILSDASARSKDTLDSGKDSCDKEILLD